MSYEIMPYISIAMFAMLFVNFAYIRFLSPIWIILFVITSGRAVTNYGLLTIVVFSVVLMFFVLGVITDYQKKAAKARKNGSDDVISIFDEDGVDSEQSSVVNLDDDESPKHAKPKKTRLKVYEGTMMSHGFAPYNDIEGNDKSYFVNCNGKKVWGIGLKDAVKNSGAEIGDNIRFWKGSEVRTSTARVFDDNGNTTGYRDLSQDKRRGIWNMEIISD